MDKINNYKRSILFVIFSLLIFLPGRFLAQSITPGGTTILNVEVWLAADKVNGPDAPLPANGTSITEWQSMLSDSRNYIASTLGAATNNNLVPTFKSSGTLFNYQPALNFGVAATKLINTRLFNDLTKSYYVFYVSNSTTNSSTASTVFSFSTNTNTSRNNNVGWISSKPFFAYGGTTGSSLRTHQGNGNTWGINAAIINSGGYYDPKSYLNGAVNTVKFNSGNLSTSTATASVIGNSSTAATLPFYGDIQEIIVLSTPMDVTISTSDLNKIQSYLAIKYGIKLDGTNYVNSNNNVIWNNSANADYSKLAIFGLGHDSRSGLYQKQAISTDSPAIAVSVGSFETLNVDNSGTIADGAFLLFGAKGKPEAGAVYYNKPAGTAFQNGSSSVDVSYRLGYTLKAQVTNTPSFTVNLKLEDQTLINNGKYLIVSADPEFDPSATRIYEFNSNKIAENVVINNGDYVAVTTAGDKGPGGVFQNMEVWLAADLVNGVGNALPADGTSVSQWKSIYSGTRDYVTSDLSTAANNIVPVFKSSGNLFNYQPAVEFKANADKLVNKTTFDKSKGYYVFYVSNCTNNSTSGSTVFTLAVNGTTAQNYNIGWINSAPYFSYGGTTSSYLRTHQGNGNTWGVNAAIITNSTTVSAQSYMNGIPSIDSFSGSLGTAASTASIIGNSSGTTALPFIGDIQELIVISAPSGTVIQTDDLNRVNSYLAVKYGIRLVGTDYVRADNVTVWDATANADFSNIAIFGIGRDDASGLYQKQAVSTDLPAIAVSLGAFESLNTNNTSTIAEDGAFLLFGASDKPESGATYYKQPAGTAYANGSSTVDVNYRLGYTLKAQATEQSSFTVNLKLVNQYLIDNSKYLVVSSDPAFAPSATRIYELGANNEISNVVINDGDYISLTSEGEKGPGGVFQNMEVWLAADQVNGPGNALPTDGASVGQWKGIYSGTRDYVTSDLSTATNNAVPTFKSSGDLFNFQPAVKFTGNTEKLVNKTLFDTSKGYAVFYVSNSTTNSSTGSTVFTFTSSGTTARNNNVGWINSAPYFSLGGTTSGYLRTHQGNGKTWGINTAIITNSTTVSAKSYLNNIPSTNNFSGTMATGASTASIIGNSNASNGLPFYGDMQELIIISSSPGYPYISELDQVKVQSYLGVKYGIRLDGMSYRRSDNTVIWDATANADYSKVAIFGIGRDDASGLYQKQSTSTDNPGVAISLGNFEDLNVNNTSTIDQDGAFLMLGAQGRTNGDAITYIKPAGTVYMEGGSIPEDVNYLLGYRLKAQVTGQSSFTVNFKVTNQQLINDGKFMLVSPDDSFDPQNTRLYFLDANNMVTNLVINDGDHIAFATKGRKGPGGVFQGMKVWVKADEYASLQFDGSGNVIGWLDQSGNNNNFSYSALTTSGKIMPTYVTCDENSNFNPAVYFQVPQAALAMASGPLDTDTPDEVTSFLVYYNTLATTNDRYYTHGFGGTNHMTEATRSPAVGFAPDEGTGRVRTTGYTYDGTRKGYYNYTTAFHKVYLGSPNSYTGKQIVHDFGGYGDVVSDNTTVNDSFYSQFKMASGMTLGGASYIASSQFVGTIPEFILFDRYLSEEEEDRIRAYMAMKYAVTLDSDPGNSNSNYDYKLSDGTVVWEGNSETNKDFHHNVAGLFRDDNATAFNNKAKSTADGGMITMMVPGHTECGQGTVSGLDNDLSGLFWGNDKGEQTVTFTQEECFDFTDMTSRKWLVQKTNLDTARVIIRAGLGNMDFDSFIHESNDAYLLVADNPEDFDNRTWKMTIPGTFVDGEFQFEYAFTREYTYFALGFKQNPSFCQTCSFQGDDSFTLTRKVLGTSSVRLRPANPTYTINSTTNDGNLGVQVLFEALSGVTSMRIRPGGNRSAVNLQSTGAAGAISRITYTLSEPADVSFAVGDIDQNETVEVYGYCEGKLVRPSYVFREPLMGARARQGYSFDIMNVSKAVGNGKQSPGRGNPRGMMHIQFGFSVEKIVIEYSNSKATLRFLDLFPMNFSCPQPPPPPNEAGYSLQKRGPLEANVCDIIDYSFSIVNANAGCDSSKVCFSDTLPEGMFWVPNSLVFEESLLDTTVVNQGKESIILQDRVLRIDSLKLPGNGKTTLVRAKAAFVDGAAINTTYYNQGQITYIRNDNGVAETLKSTDTYYVSGNDKRTPTFVLNEERDFTSVTAEMSLKPSDCYRENNEIEVTLVLNNPNLISVDDMALEISYNENFHFVPGSFKINGADPGSGVDIWIEADEDGEEMLGFTIVEGFQLPANQSGTSPTVITYRIKAPGLDALEYDEVDGQKIYYSADIAYDLFTYMEAGACLENAFLNTIGLKELPYCTSKKYIITNKHVTNKIRK